MYLCVVCFTVHNIRTFFQSGVTTHLNALLTACDDGDPSATESTLRKAFSFVEISETKIIQMSTPGKLPLFRIKLYKK